MIPEPYILNPRPHNSNPMKPDASPRTLHINPMIPRPQTQPIKRGARSDAACPRVWQLKTASGNLYQAAAQATRKVCVVKTMQGAGDKCGLPLWVDKHGDSCHLKTSWLGQQLKVLPTPSAPKSDPCTLTPKPPIRCSGR